MSHPISGCVRSSAGHELSALPCAAQQANPVALLDLKWQVLRRGPGLRGNAVAVPRQGCPLRTAYMLAMHRRRAISPGCQYRRHLGWTGLPVTMPAMPTVVVVPVTPMAAAPATPIPAMPNFLHRATGSHLILNGGRWVSNGSRLDGTAKQRAKRNTGGE